MKFAAVIQYTADQKLIADTRPNHRAYLTNLLETGRLLACGPFQDDSGALIIYEADSLEAAQHLVRNDPFNAAGVFVSYELKPWKVVMGNSALLLG